MSDKKLEAACHDVADNISTMMNVLHSRGFTRDEAILMISGMLASTQVYTPFAGVVESPVDGVRH